MRAPTAQARALAALMMGRQAAVPLDGGLAAAAVDHGIAPILHRALVQRGQWPEIAPPVRDVLTHAAREALIVEPIRHAHLERTIAALASSGVAPLLFKGAALAHTHYPEPWLRVRGDTDLLVRKEDTVVVDDVLTRLGLVRLPRPNGPRVIQQARYTVRWQSVEIAYDVHWRLAEPHVFADTLPYEVLESASVEGPVAGARRIGDVHALVVACVHRAAHHFDADNLLMLYDIRLLAEGLSDVGWRRFCGEASAGRLRAVCRRGLTLAADLFGPCVPGFVVDRLQACDDEPSAVFVKAPITRLTVLRSDLRALPTWRDRIALLYEHVFPPAEYLRHAADDRSRSPVPLMYLGRLLRGLNAWRQPL